MKATPRNMQRLLTQAAEPIAVPGVFAYCPVCGGESSASPGDYWDYSEDEPLEHCEQPMILARKQTHVIPID